MKKLYIVRHAKSSWALPHLDDFDRPLNNRGQHDAPEMGLRFKKRKLKVDGMLSSPAVRALSTSQIIAGAMGFPKGGILTEKRLYHASEREILRIVQKQSDSWNHMMIVGHNPGFTWFSNELTGVVLSNIPTCGIVACTLPVASWKEVEFGQGHFDFFDFPKNR
jgi:phosphohistidine phosphatase